MNNTISTDSTVQSVIVLYEGLNPKVKELIRGLYFSDNLLITRELIYRWLLLIGCDSSVSLYIENGIHVDNSDPNGNTGRAQE